MDDLGHDDDILHTTTNEQSMKEIIYKLCLVIIKTFCSEKDKCQKTDKASHILGDKYLQKTHLIS